MVSKCSHFAFFFLSLGLDMNHDLCNSEKFRIWRADTDERDNNLTSDTQYFKANSAMLLT